MDRDLQDVISYNPSEDEDYYKILGCDELSTKEQISTEYKLLALQCHPDKFSGNTEKAKQFERIQTAKDILCDDEKRFNYDKWRHAGLSIPFQKWCNMREAVHTSMHWVTPKKERMLEDKHGTNISDQTREHTSVKVPNAALHSSSSSIRPPPRPWARDYEPSESLKKFRNYEI